MGQEHLKPGEIEHLYSYLMYRSESGVSDDELIAAAGEDIAAVVEFVNSNVYENSSTFGRNLKEIMANSKNHLSSCDKCFGQYEVHVKNIAASLRLVFSRTLQRAAVAKNPPIIGEASCQETKTDEYITELDYLRLLGR